MLHGYANTTTINWLTVHLQGQTVATWIMNVLAVVSTGTYRFTKETVQMKRIIAIGTSVAIAAVIITKLAFGQADWKEVKVVTMPTIPAYFYYLELRQDYGEPFTTEVVAMNDWGVRPAMLKIHFLKGDRRATLEVVIGQPESMVLMVDYRIWLSYSAEYHRVQITYYER